MHILGYPWTSMDIHGYPWTFMDIHGLPWITMDITGYAWIISIVTAKDLYISLDIYGYPRVSIGHLWTATDSHCCPILESQY